MKHENIFFEKNALTYPAFSEEVNVATKISIKLTTWPATILFKFADIK